MHNDLPERDCASVRQARISIRKADSNTTKKTREVRQVCGKRTAGPENAENVNRNKTGTDQIQIQEILQAVEQCIPAGTWVEVQAERWVRGYGVT